jgi:nitroimidazol reductase NimA-like FMN-containing flavoprotein (pyridoxamine 5'-phosphate oxidase superfamily)
MKPMPDADESRRLAVTADGKADKLPEEARKQARKKKARDHEDNAHAKDWRDAHLHPPK